MIGSEQTERSLHIDSFEENQVWFLFFSQKRTNIHFCKQNVKRSLSKRIPHSMQMFYHTFSTWFCTELIFHKIFHRAILQRIGCFPQNFPQNRISHEKRQVQNKILQNFVCILRDFAQSYINFLQDCEKIRQDIRTKNHTKQEVIFHGKSQNDF